MNGKITKELFKIFLLGSLCGIFALGFFLIFFYMTDKNLWLAIWGVGAECGLMGIILKNAFH